jgi:hypothetical protein
MIEHARSGDYKLTSPKEADETTPAVYRFRRKLDPHRTIKLTVVTEMIATQEVQILAGTPDDLKAVYLRSATIPKNVRDALAKAIQMKSDLISMVRQIADKQQFITNVTVEQSRIRENMKSVSADTDYYKRLVKKLDEQETAIEKTQKEIAEDRKASETLMKQLEQYLMNLTLD